MTGGYLWYAIVITLLTLSGRGLLWIRPAGLRRRQILLLAPCAGQTLAAIVLGATISGGVAIQHAYVFVWLAMLSVATLGARAAVDDWRQSRRESPTSTPPTANTTRASAGTQRHHASGLADEESTHRRGASRGGTRANGPLSSGEGVGGEVVFAPAGLAGMTATREASWAAVWGCLAIAAIVPLIVMLPYLRGGLTDYMGSGLGDGWSYVALGQYYWDYPRGMDAAPSPFYRYGAIFSQMRFVTGAELAWLSSLIRPGDAQAASGLVQASGVFGFLASCAAFAWGRAWSSRWTLLYVLLVGVSGWTMNIVWASNYDQLLALGYFPAMCAIVVAPSPLATKGSLLGVLAAGLLYTYPDLAWLPIAATVVLIANVAWRRRQPVTRLLATAAIVGGVLLIPYAPTLFRFVSDQAFKAMQASERPGAGMFFGLLSRDRLMSALWGLGGEVGLNRWAAIQTGIGVALTVLFLIGVAQLVRLREWAMLAIIGGLIAGVTLFGVGMAYPYAMYKIIITGWWLIAFTLLTGAAWLAARRRGGAIAAAIGLAVVLAIPAAAAVRAVALSRDPALLWAGRSVSMSEFRAIREIVPLVGAEPVGLLIHDPEAAYWALYHLRDRRTRLGAFPGHLSISWVRARLTRAEPLPWTAVHFVVTDARRASPFADTADCRLLWSRGPYSLWDTRAAACSAVSIALEPE